METDSLVRKKLAVVTRRLVSLSEVPSFVLVQLTPSKSQSRVAEGGLRRGYTFVLIDERFVRLVFCSLFSNHFFLF